MARCGSEFRALTVGIGCKRAEYRWEVRFFRRRGTLETIRSEKRRISVRKRGVDGGDRRRSGWEGTGPPRRRAFGLELIAERSTISSHSIGGAPKMRRTDRGMLRARGWDESTGEVRTERPERPSFPRSPPARLERRGWKTLFGAGVKTRRVGFQGREGIRG